LQEQTPAVVDPRHPEEATMKPSEVRSRVLEDHADLRVLLDAVEDLAVRAQSGRRAAINGLRERGEALAYRLRDHLALEDEHLLPLVHKERGGTVAEQLSAEHRDQRMVIEFILERLDDSSRPTHLLVREISTFAELLRADMAHEEEDLLQEPFSEGSSGTSDGPGRARPAR